MNRTIKLLALVLLGIIGVQSAQAQFRYAALGGATFSNLKFKQDLVTISSDIGVQAGVQAELMFPGIGFGMDFGFIYNMAGAKVNLGERLMWASQGYGNENLRLHQLQLPFHLRFKYTHLMGFEETLAPFVYGGPDININVAHSKCDAMTFAGGDVSLTAGLGVEILKKWQLSGSYSWGMTYAMKANVLQEYSSRTRQWTVRLAYFF